MSNIKEYPLGKILHIVEGEGICMPNKPFVAKGARVMTLDQQIIGKLGDPFGPSDKPYQPIQLDNKWKNDSSIIGKMVIAQHFKNKKRRRKKRKNN